MKTPKHITIIGRRWFQRTNGNTYHSVDVWVNGKHVYRLDYVHGYGDQYLQSATEWLKENGFINPEHYRQSGCSESLQRYCQRKKINLVCTVSDVGRKRDL